MSMLTPPGMGGKYKITGDKYPRMRQRRRRGKLVAAVVASVAALAIIAWGTLQLIDVFTGGGKTASAAGTKADCGSGVSPSAGNSAGAKGAAAPKPGQITVNVYNATTRSGLAKSTADELKKRGFKIGDVGNAAKAFDKKVKGTGVLLGPASSLNSSLPVLATQLTTAERRTDAARKGADLDLIIGDGFKTLTARPTADKALSALQNPKPAPTSKKAC
ncbi:LytR C-terminal domain-containing protein [Streptomyces spinosirectus]